MKLKVKLQREYESKTETLTLVNYKKDLQRCVNITYPRDWDCVKLDLFISVFHDIHIRQPYPREDCGALTMKNRLEEIKELGYRVIAINHLYGYIVRRDGKFLLYCLAKYTSNGCIYFTYKYKPSRTEGQDSIQGGENAYNFGYDEFSNEMIYKMMDSPKLYGKVEHYKDFKEFCQRESRFCSVLKKFI